MVARLWFSPHVIAVCPYFGVGPVACSEFWSVCHEIRRPSPELARSSVNDRRRLFLRCLTLRARAGPCGISQGRFSMLVQLSVTRRSAPQLAESLGLSPFFLFSNISGISPVGGHFSGSSPAGGHRFRFRRRPVATGQRPGSNLWAIVRHSE